MQCTTFVSSSATLRQPERPSRPAGRHQLLVAASAQHQEPNAARRAALMAGIGLGLGLGLDAAAPKVRRQRQLQGCELATCRRHLSQLRAFLLPAAAGAGIGADACACGHLPASGGGPARLLPLPPRCKEDACHPRGRHQGRPGFLPVCAGGCRTWHRAPATASNSVNTGCSRSCVQLLLPQALPAVRHPPPCHPCAASAPPSSQPESWAEAQLLNILTGNFCMPRCEEPWYEAKFENPKEGSAQVRAGVRVGLGWGDEVGARRVNGFTLRTARAHMPLGTHSGARSPRMLPARQPRRPSAAAPLGAGSGAAAARPDL